MVHITNNPDWRRADYVYDENGVGYPRGLEPYINWKHIDGPLLYTSDCQFHWLTYRERIQFFFGLTDIHALNQKHQRKSAVKP
jgi:hypothetical protein